MTALDVLCCFALFVWTLLASFFHLSFKNMYNYVALMVVITVFMHMYKKLIHRHVLMRDERRKEERRKEERSKQTTRQSNTAHLMYVYEVLASAFNLHSFNMGQDSSRALV